MTSNTNVEQRLPFIVRSMSDAGLRPRPLPGVDVGLATGKHGQFGLADLLLYPRVEAECVAHQCRDCLIDRDGRWHMSKLFDFHGVSSRS